LKAQELLGAQVNRECTGKANVDLAADKHDGSAVNDPAIGPASGYQSSCSVCESRRGILKRVRFQGVYEPVEEEKAQEQDVPVHVSSPTGSAARRTYGVSLSTPSSGILCPPSPSLPAPPPPPPMEAPRPPALFNKAIETNEFLNAAAFRLYTNFIDELSDFVAQQGDVVAMRLSVQERRKELHRLREHVSRSDMMLFNCMREQRNGGHSLGGGAIADLFEASRTARDQIGPVESEYEPLEILLGAKEHQLVEKYSKIEGSFDHFFRLNINPTSKPDEPPDIEYEASSTASVSEENTPRPDHDYLHGAMIGENVGIGQLPMRMEELKPRSPERRQFGVSHRRTASLGSTEFSRPRSTVFSDEAMKAGDSSGILSFIGIWTIDMKDPAGADTMLEKEYEYQTAFFEDNWMEISDASPDSMDDFSVNPGLEEGNPLLLLDESNETRAILSEYLVEFESTPDRVNRWMLHQLRVSPREIYALHRRIAEATSDSWHWATSVLKRWPHDSFGYSNPSYQGSIELGESDRNPQVLGYHGACPPECRITDDWPDQDAWLARRSSTFTVTDIAPTRPAQLDTDSSMPSLDECSVEPKDDD
jgi:hypothetical protein